jgi:hypothetical protein
VRLGLPDASSLTHTANSECGVRNAEFGIGQSSVGSCQLSLGRTDWGFREWGNDGVGEWDARPLTPCPLSRGGRGERLKTKENTGLQS